MIVFNQTEALTAAQERASDAFVKAAAAARDDRIDDLPAIEVEYLAAHRDVLRETIKSVRTTKQPERGSWTHPQGDGESAVPQ